MARRSIVGLGFLLAVTAAAFAADTLDERLRQLEEQNREILERLRRSEQEVERLRDHEKTALENEIEEYLQGDGGALEGEGPLPTQTKKGALFRLYGFIRFDLLYNTARMNSNHFPVYVHPENGVNASSNDDQFGFDARMTRIGLEFEFGQVGPTMVTGKIETDFQNFVNGVQESRATPRIRLAFIQLETETWRARFGQDWDVISPLYPSANLHAVMWWAGNIGDRRPMVAFTWKKNPKFVWTVALGFTGAVDNLDADAGLGTYASTERDGFDSGLPHLQGRGAFTLDGWVDGKGIVVGLWGLVGTLETDTAFNGETDYVTWVVGADFTVPVTAKLLARGEVWIGEALGDVRGTIGQSINTATGDEIAGLGGWAELQYVHDERWRFHAGGTIDNPDNGDLPANGRELNLTLYAGFVRTYARGLRAGFDVLFWETQWAGLGIGNTVRFDFWTTIDF